MAFSSICAGSARRPLEPCGGHTIITSQGSKRPCIVLDHFGQSILDYLGQPLLVVIKSTNAPPGSHLLAWTSLFITCVRRNTAPRLPDGTTNEPAHTKQDLPRQRSGPASTASQRAAAKAVGSRSFAPYDDEPVRSADLATGWCKREWFKALSRLPASAKYPQSDPRHNPHAGHCSARIKRPANS